MTWSVAFGFIRNGVMSIQTIRGHCFYEIPMLYIEYATWVASLALKNQPVSFRESMLQILAYNKFHVTANEANCGTQRIEYVIDDKHNPAIFVDRNKLNDDYYEKNILLYNGVFLSIALLNYDTGCFEYYRANDLEIKSVVCDNPKHSTMECKYSLEVLNTPQYVSIPFTHLVNIKPNYEAIISFQNMLQQYPELI